MSIEELSKTIQNAESLNNEVRLIQNQLAEVNLHLEKIAKGALIFHRVCYFVGAMALVATIPIVLVVWPHFPRLFSFISEHLEYFDKLR